jgi:hypothetical protein
MNSRRIQMKLNKIRKATQDVKRKLKNNIEILKKLKSRKEKSSLSQIKTSVESLSIILNQMEDRISGLETK